MSDVAPQQVMLAAAIIFGLATACQVVAPRLRIPALVLLLPVGFLFGLLAPQLRLDDLLGSAFSVGVDLIVAVILFQGGMELTAIPLRGSDRHVVWRLVWLGGAITFLAGALAAHYLIGMEWPIAFMLGAILIVSGPTVVTPILTFVRPHPRVRSLLVWEGTLLDPIGALFAVVVFQLVKASSSETLAEGVGLFFYGAGVAVVAALIGATLFVVGGRLAKGSAMLGTQVLLGSVIVAAGLANTITEDSGLLAALLLGMVAPRIARRFGASLNSGIPFFDTVVSIGIGVLFISIAALVPSPSLLTILVPTLIMAALFIFIGRPLSALVCTTHAHLQWRERAFIAWMDPRGIVAAATASSVGAALVALKVPGAQDLLPAAFVIIAVTVTVYGLTSAPIANLLKVRQTAQDPATADGAQASGASSTH